jgi:hypothetical protein
MKVVLRDYLAVCVSVYSPSPTISFWMPEPVFMKLGMCIMAPQPISVAYFINPSHQSVCLYVYPRISFLGNGSVNTLPRQRVHETKKNYWTRRFLWRPCSFKVECVSFSAFPSVVARQKKCWRRRFVCGQWRIKESRRLVLPRTSCVECKFSLSFRVFKPRKVTSTAPVGGLGNRRIHI